MSKLYEESLTILDVLNLAKLRLETYYSNSSMSTKGNTKYLLRLREVNKAIDELKSTGQLSLNSGVNTKNST